MPDEKHRAERLIRDSLVWDMTLPGMFSDLNDIGTLDRYLAAGYGFVSITVGNDSVCDPDIVPQRLSQITTTLERQPDKFVIVRSSSEIQAAQTRGKLAISFNLQGTNCLDGDVSRVAQLSGLGVTHMLLAYNNKNAVGGGCAEETDAGLSRFGIRFIEEMNRVGMIVDGSHCGYRTTMEAIEVSRAPFIFSHSNAFGVFPHYRNIRDDQVKACAATGGVVGVNGVGAFLSDTGDASAETIFRHVDYLAELVGARHVGLGFDFIIHVERFAAMARKTADQWPSNDGRPVRFDNFAPPEIVSPVVDLMCRHRYSDEDVRGILGGNFLRVFTNIVDGSAAAGKRGAA